MATPVAIGIDLGTTYSITARMDEQGRSAIVRNLHGDLLTPSVVFFDDDEIVVGKAAKKVAHVHPDRIAECAKREIGNRYYSRPIHGQQIPPEAILGSILSRLKEDIQDVVGSDFKAVVTVPAYFDEPRRKATADAAQIAGIDLIDIVNEPTAAALAFGEQLGYLTAGGEARETIRVLVYDLGGGTFDVTVIELSPGNIQTLATDGDVQLGGRDWDLLLAKHVAEQFHSRHRIDVASDAAVMDNLVRAVEESKHTLSLRDHATVRLEHQGVADEIKIGRSEFEKISQGLLERTAFTTRQVLTAAGLTWQDISRILLVGGSTRMPMVPAMIEQLSHISPDRSINPDEAVARGAALFASYQLKKRTDQSASPFQVTDVSAHSLGIQGIQQDTLRRENVIIIPRNTPLPAQVTRPFVTQTANQNSVVVLVLEGESSEPGLCSQIGHSVLRHLPANLPQGYPVSITFSYGSNARLSVEAALANMDHRVTIELQRERDMSSEELGLWRQIMDPQDGTLVADLLHEAFGVGTQNASTPAQEQPTSPRDSTIAEQPETEPASPIGNTSGLSHGSPSSEKSASENISTPYTDAAMGTLPTMHTEQMAGTSPTFSFDTAIDHKARRRQAIIRRTIFIFGHIISSAIGLAVGYYILCRLRPDADFLHLFSQ